MLPNEKVIVADIGARYGIHPNWNNFSAPMHYFAFEPDGEEADRLHTIYQESKNFKYEVVEKALDKINDVRDFHLLRHRGLSSCLKPDLTSECFRHLKPSQAEIEKVLQIKMERTDDVFEKMDLVPDFLKVDTEGTEQDVIEGAEGLFKKGVLGIRSSCNFQACFVGQRLFHESQEYLLKHDFVLLNLDYKGYGYPRLGLFRKPDPIESEDTRYGVLVAADAVWIRKDSALDAMYSGLGLTMAKLKLAAFCFLNNAPDMAVDMMREMSAKGHFTEELQQDSYLYIWLKLKCARFLGRYRTVPDEHWNRAQYLYKEIFGEDLMGGSYFYPQVNEMANKLKAME